MIVSIALTITIPNIIQSDNTYDVEDDLIRHESNDSCDHSIDYHYFNLRELNILT